MSQYCELRQIYVVISGIATNLRYNSYRYYCDKRNKNTTVAIVSLKSTHLKLLILSFFEEKDTLNLQEIVKKAGCSPNSLAGRRAIQRALKSLIRDDLVQPQGNARARMYILKKNLTKALMLTKNDGLFQDIHLTEGSTRLLQYLAKPTSARKPVDYNQDFLNSYIPNQTAYLTSSIRKQLHQVGKVESVIRPAGTYARNILNKLLIDLSWNSSRLEGNTYSLLETKRLIELGENAVGKNAIETQMILNHKEAIEYIIESAADEKITAHEVCSIHALLSENLLGDPSASGRLRMIAVGISGTTYNPLENHHLLKEYFDVIINKMNLIEDPFEQSFFSLVHLSYLQAFEDVNKRTARIVANIPLIKCNLKPLSFTDVNQNDYVMSLLGVYEKNNISILHDLYVWAYKKSSQKYSALQQEMGEPNLFKLKYRSIVKEIVRKIVLDKVPGSLIVSTIKELIKVQHLVEPDSIELFNLLEREIISLHEGNIARFKIRPSEFQQWKDVQG